MSNKLLKIQCSNNVRQLPHKNQLQEVFQLNGLEQCRLVLSNLLEFQVITAASSTSE